jgi:hypothetical protein
MAASLARKTADVLPEEPHKRGYLARAMVQCTLPHSDPKVDLFQRQDGNIILTIRSGYDPLKKGMAGIPYGPIAKLLLVWITSEGVKSEDGVLVLAKTLGTFLKALDMSRDTGRGKRSDAKRVAEQLNRLVRAEFGFYNVGETPLATGADEKEIPISTERSLWWSKKDPEQAALFDSFIILSPQFLAEIKKSYVPVDLTIAGRLKKSPLALDLFFWMTYRLYRMDVGEDITVSWRDLASQFGADYSTEKNLRAAVKRALAMVAKEWKAADKASDLGMRGLTLHGIPKSHLPIQERVGELAFQRRRSSPYDLSPAELIKAKSHAGKLDIFTMRDDWEKWCKTRKIVPDSPVGHFIDFLQKHQNKRPKKGTA